MTVRFRLNVFGLVCVLYALWLILGPIPPIALPAIAPVERREIQHARYPHFTGLLDCHDELWWEIWKAVGNFPCQALIAGTPEGVS